MAVAPEDFTADEGYVGEGYGKVTPECRAAIRLAAESEGLFLDPVYTGKAMAGLVDKAARGEIGADETVVFVHTGGTPALFAYAGDLIDG